MHFFKPAKRRWLISANADCYCFRYEKVLNETIGMLREESQLTAKGIEVIVQGFMMANTG